MMSAGKIEELERRVAELEAKFRKSKLSFENETLELGASYHLIGSNSKVEAETWDGEEFDNEVRSSGNCFESEQVAERIAKRRRSLQRLEFLALQLNGEDWKPRYIDIEYYLYYDVVDDKMKINSAPGGEPDVGVVYFRNAELALQAIDEMGDELKELFR